MYRALVSFSGIISMAKGETIETISDEFVLKDLLKAGYIEEVKTENENKRSNKRANK